jgi:putative pyruvate formate lyase activating enzyme
MSSVGPPPAAARPPPNEFGSASRSALARERIVTARAALADCRLCAHECRVNRLAGDTGRCRAGAGARIFSAQIESGDELDLIPTFAIALSGCDLRCEFCITAGPSWNPRAGEPLDVARVAAQAGTALTRGARSVMILGGEPTIHLPTVIELVASMPDTATLVWRTNAHASTQARELLDGLFDVWVADLKFGNDTCAERLANVPQYSRFVQENLRWAAARTRLVVRHLLMPGHLDCCWRPVAEWLRDELPGVKVSLRTGYWPIAHATRHSELRRTLSTTESARAAEIARANELNLVE